MSGLVTTYWTQTDRWWLHSAGTGKHLAYVNETPRYAKVRFFWSTVTIDGEWTQGWARTLEAAKRRAEAAVEAEGQSKGEAT